MKGAWDWLRFTRPRCIVAVGVALVLASFILHPSAFILPAVLSAQTACLPPEQAAAHVGETACIEGQVTNALWAERSNGRPTFLDFGASFTVVIWEEDRAKFNPPPETRRGQRLRVQGAIETFRGKAQIVVRNPSQLGPAGVPLPALAATTARIATVAATSAATASLTATPSMSPTLVPGTAMTPLAVIGTRTPIVVTPAAPPPDARVTGQSAVPFVPDETATETSVRWPLVAAGFGLVGAGVAGAAWYGLRRRTS